MWPWKKKKPPWRCIMAPTAVIHETGRICNCARGDERIQIGEHTHVRGELLTFGHGGSVILGDYCYVGEQTRIWSGDRIEIGNRVLIAHMVSIIDNQSHPLDPVLRHEQYKTIITSGHPREIDLDDKPIVIEDDAWIAANATILRGVRVGRAAVIGTGSVVTEDVEPYTVVAGNPARVIKTIPRTDATGD